MTRNEDGFTLAELIVAMGLGMIILLAAFTLMDVTLNQTRNVTQRVETTQRGRLALDQLTRGMRSQVCVASGKTMLPGFVGGDATSLTIHRDLTPVPAPGQPIPVTAADRVTYELKDGVLKESVYKPTVIGTNPPAYPTSPTRTRTLATNVYPVTGKPAFTYWGYDTSDPPRPIVQVTPSTVTAAATVAFITVRFTARPPGSTSRKNAIVLEDGVFIRTTNPHDDIPVPKCAPI